MEATKCLKPSDNGHEFGGRASVQAATQVNAEQASKMSCLESRDHRNVQQRLCSGTAASQSTGEEQ